MTNLGKWQITKHKGSWWIFKPGERIPFIQLSRYEEVLAYCRRREAPQKHVIQDRHGVEVCSCGFLPPVDYPAIAREQLALHARTMNRLSKRVNSEGMKR
jgi:hypothetical protein